MGDDTTRLYDACTMHRKDEEQCRQMEHLNNLWKKFYTPSCGALSAVCETLLRSFEWDDFM